MEILGNISAILIGVSLGLIGGGGSILTVPVLVYLFNVDPVLATAYSLFVVGLSSLTGAIRKYKNDLVSVKTAIVFGIPSLTAVFLTRKLIVPAIPPQVFSAEGFVVTKATLMMVLFAGLMVAASFAMIRGTIDNSEEEALDQQYNYPLIIAQGAIMGLLTGLVGAGGGFLIIPALVILGKLPMKKAVGTSLLIIAVNSLIGFTGDVSENGSAMDWKLLLMISSLSISGIFIGNYLSTKIDGAKLKKGFGWFVLVMGIYILTKELILK